MPFITEVVVGRPLHLWTWWLCARGILHLGNYSAKMKQAPKSLRYLSTLLLSGKLGASMTDELGYQDPGAGCHEGPNSPSLCPEMRHRCAERCTNAVRVLLLQEVFACYWQWGAQGLRTYSSKTSGCLILSHHNRSGALNFCDDLAYAAWLCLHRIILKSSI